mgnify:CR=1 FL=1
MLEEHLTIETDEGEMSTFIVRPESDGPFPVVLFLMDAPGKREELHDMARRIAATGYFVMLPNLYYRDVMEFHLGLPGATRERMRELTRKKKLSVGTPKSATSRSRGGRTG